MTETRKLAAILAADVVGYSRLMGGTSGDGAGGARASLGGGSARREQGRPHRQRRLATGC